MTRLIESKKKELVELCKLLKVQRMNVFGSAATGEYNEDSDIDILVSFSDNLSVQEYGDNYFQLHYKLRELFNRDIDITTERTLSNPFFIESINETKQLIYEA